MPVPGPVAHPGMPTDEDDGDCGDDEDRVVPTEAEAGSVTVTVRTGATAPWAGG